MTDASARGVSGPLRDAGGGNDIIVERHGRAVVAVVRMDRLAGIANLEAGLRSAALVLARAANDDGTRFDLDDVIAALGSVRARLEAELDAEPAVEDLRRLLAGDPQVVRNALERMLTIERAHEAGEPRLGSLVGWRNLVVGDNHWRIVWR